MIIAQISDTHISLDAPDADQRIKDFERTIADINSLDPAPDVIVHTGDVVHNGRLDEYRECVRVLSAAQAPVYALVGNKDDRSNFSSAFGPAEFVPAGSPFIDYSIEDFTVRIIVTDTLDPASNKGEFCPERAERLRQMIDADKTRPIAIFAHHPPFEVLVGPEPFHFGNEAAMERLRQSILYSGRVIGIFSGHVHRSTLGKVGAINAAVMSSTATSLRWGDFPQHMKHNPIYYIHRYNAGGWFNTETRIVR